MLAATTSLKTSVSILSDSRIVREVLGAWLQRQEEIQWVATAGSTHQLLQRLNGRAAEFLLVHAKVDGVLGRHLVFDVRTLFPAAHLIVLRCQPGERERRAWFEAGAMALHVDSSPEQLLQCLREAALGWPQPSVAMHWRRSERFQPGLWQTASGDGFDTGSFNGGTDVRVHERLSGASSRQERQHPRQLFSALHTSRIAFRRRFSGAAGE